MTFRATERIVAAQGVRVVLETDAPLAELRRRFEELVPAVDPALEQRLLAGALDWAAFARASASLYGLRRFRTEQPGDAMRLAGAGETGGTVYLLGDHELAARLFRHDPATAIAVPFRAELHVPRRAAGRGGGDSGGAVFAFEQPSAVLASFGLNKISEVGVELDRRLGDVLEAIELPRPSVLRR